MESVAFHSNTLCRFGCRQVQIVINYSAEDFTMSQAKVDAYKERKKNRKKEALHEKHMTWLRIGIAVLVVALIAAWGGYSAYVTHENNKPHQEATVNYDAVNDYTSGMAEAADTAEK